MEKPKTKTKSKSKLIASLTASLMCLIVAGISVYAATSQSIVINDSITITTEGQSLVAVTVAAKLGETDSTLLTVDEPGLTKLQGGTGEASWDTIASVAAGESSTTGNTGKNPVFSVTNAYTYYAYRIVMDNVSTTTAASYAITIADIALPASVTMHYSSTDDWDTTAILSGTVAASSTVTVYVVFAINTAIANLTSFATDPFTLNINLTA